MAICRADHHLEAPELPAILISLRMSRPGLMVSLPAVTFPTIANLKGDQKGEIELTQGAPPDRREVLTCRWGGGSGCSSSTWACRRTQGQHRREGALWFGHPQLAVSNGMGWDGMGWLEATRTG